MFIFIPQHLSSFLHHKAKEKNGLLLSSTLKIIAFEYFVLYEWLMYPKLAHFLYFKTSFYMKTLDRTQHTAIIGRN